MMTGYTALFYPSAQEQCALGSDGVCRCGVAGGAYALSGGAGGGAGGVAERKVVALAALDDAKVAARLRDDAGGNAGAIAVALEESLCDGLHSGIPCMSDTN